MRIAGLSDRLFFFSIYKRQSVYCNMRQLNSLEENALKISKYSTIAFVIFFFFFIGFVAESARPLYILGRLILIVWKYIAYVAIKDLLHIN